MPASNTGCSPSGVSRDTSMRVLYATMRLMSSGPVKFPTRQCSTAVGGCAVTT